MIRDDTIIGPKTRARMISNRAHFMRQDNPRLPKEIALQISQSMQACYERQLWEMFDLHREIAESYDPDNEHTHVEPIHV